MRTLAKCACLVFTLQLAAVTSGQVFKVQAGGSTLLDAEGGSVEFSAPNYAGTLGIGVHAGQFVFGAETKLKYRSSVLLFGDDSVPFNLPTDIFNPSHYFSARGAGLSRTNERQHLYVFGGSTATFLGAGFFNSATANDPVGIVFYDRKLTKSLRFISRDIASNRQTALEALEWSPLKQVTASLTGGVGSNQRYFASAVDVETNQLAVKTSYVATGTMFRRITVTSPFASEVNKGNIELLYRPGKFFSITTGHQDVLQPVTRNGPMQEAAVNEVVTSFHIEKFYFGAGLFQSHAALGDTQGTNLYVGRSIFDRFEVSTNYFASQPRNGSRSTIVSGLVRENLTHRFSLLQLVSHSNGQTTVAYGGGFTGNRLMLNVDYQNVYLPFRPDRPFEQALAFNAALRVFGPLQMTALSSVDPGGHIRYTFGLSTYLYHLGGMRSADGAPPAAVRIAKYLVEGEVRDDKGNPVEGAALHIGRELAYSDSQGHLLARFSKPGPFALTLAPDEFTTPGLYELVSAPHEVKADVESRASNIKIVIRRVPTRQAALPAPAPRSAAASSATPISTNAADSSSDRPPTGVPSSTASPSAEPASAPATMPISVNFGDDKPAGQLIIGRGPTFLK